MTAAPREDDGAAHFLAAFDAALAETAAAIKATTLAAVLRLLCPACAARINHGTQGAGGTDTEGEPQ